MSASNRDPFAEFSEHLVMALLGGSLATNRVQKDYDLTTADGLKVQVRYLANTTGAVWVNEHVVRCDPGVDRYALVLFEVFSPVAVLVFPPVLTAIGAALGKRHPNQEVHLQFTRANFWTIRDGVERFRELGVQVWLPPFGAS